MLTLPNKKQANFIKNKKEKNKHQNITTLASLKPSGETTIKKSVPEHKQK